MNSWAAWLHALADCQLLRSPDSPGWNSLSRFNGLHSPQSGLSESPRLPPAWLPVDNPTKGKTLPALFQRRFILVPLQLLRGARADAEVRE